MMNATADNGCYRQYNILSKIKRAAAKDVDYRRRRGWILSPIVDFTAYDGRYRQYNILSQMKSNTAKDMDYRR
jgi:hypothetical protein